MLLIRGGGEMVSKIEIVNLCEHLLNKDISFPITHNPPTFTWINEIWMEGSLSPNVDIGPRFNVM